MGNLYDFTKMCTSADAYVFGTELNKFVTDITGILADQVLNRADVAAIMTKNNLSGNMVIDVAAGLAVATNANQIQITNAFTYTIGGAVYSRAAEDNIVLANAGASALECAISAFASYLVTVNATGAIALVKSADATSAALALAAMSSAVIPASVAAVGVVHVQNNGTAFTPGSTGAGLGTFDDDTTADTWIDFVGVDIKAFGAQGGLSQTDSAAYTQTFTTIT